MRKKGQSWLLLLVFFVVIWAVGKKDSPRIEAPLSQAPVKSLTTASSLAPQTTQKSITEHFVNADKLNLRAQPGGKVISQLKRGEKVQVYEQQNEWARISLDGQPQRWISYKNLCSGANCFISLQPKRERLTPQPARSTTSEYGSSCPCSSGRICIGPRGGRYCITSGGNKRYGV
ncbi:SH3 domain-containing protein [Pseudomonas mosselii]|uniref:SH3 domain-containing protein n=1 Tax=Pseudomonas mosselii TaxID=78327 RepID=UPI00244CEDBC|nr:SH3 domain-containing protein [Pseudomonas mosselii]MDH0628984.1 SH3 domain-containing protein [Pseudomonas mosselii]MDH0677222.1 SH3 domain-containing protein [Pseudomonas mosselii]MDH0928262.1 SH3 domain-containing protein [Pseudomonas mosselii]MDH1135832.1 SH3 domain-containing protein [Pseudomonas mosselii]MDH1141092.1 SH3 domain-containing protein [Pseudomonas mosselii]